LQRRNKSFPSKILKMFEPRKSAATSRQRYRQLEVAHSNPQLELFVKLPYTRVKQKLQLWKQATNKATSDSKISASG
jgi:hypothetical protein